MAEVQGLSRGIASRGFRTPVAFRQMMTRAMIAFVMCLFGTTLGAANIVFNVDFNDADGPHWTGLVDTDADTLTINTWTENAGGVDYWTPAPSMLPWVWTAKTSTGSFDVPTGWDGTMDNSWGFLPPETDNTLITWNEGTHTFSARGLGWAAGRTGGSVNGFGAVNLLQLVPDGIGSVRVANGSVAITPVPEATAFMSLSLVGLAGAAIGWWRETRKRHLATHS